MTAPYTELAQRCLDSGLKSLSADEEHTLYVLFRKEIRKKAFKISGKNSANILIAFCNHILNDSEDLLVIDFQRNLRICANNLSTGRVPIAALILYATCIEHWINMIITIAKLRAGLSVHEVEAYLGKEPTIHERMTELKSIPGLPRLPEPICIYIYELFGRRNDYAHYTWHAQKPEKVAVLHRRIISIVQESEGKIAEMKSFEWENFDGQDDALAKALFPRAKYDVYLNNF